MHIQQMMELFQIFLVFFLEHLRSVYSQDSIGSTYEFTFSDHISKDGVMKEIENIGNRIHCASTCFREPECKGFGYGTNKMCSLLSVFLKKDYCPDDENCLSRRGTRVYMVKEVMTTTTEIPTSTTTDQPTTKVNESSTTTVETTPLKESTTTTIATTTTKAPTTTTTEAPTTTTKAPTTTTTTEAPTTTPTTEAPTTITTTKAPTTTTTTEPTTTTKVQTTTEPATTTTTPETSTLTTTNKPTTTTPAPETTTTTEATTSTTEAVTTTTTSEPETSTPIATTKLITTEEPTTLRVTTPDATTPQIDEETTSTTESHTTTTTEAPQILIAECGDDDDLMQGFHPEKVFFIAGLETTICNKMPNEFFGTKIDEYFLGANEAARCPENSVLTTVRFAVVGNLLLSYEAVCREIKSDFWKQGDVKYLDSKDTKFVDCTEGYGMTTLKVLVEQNDEYPEYSMVVNCQKIEKTEAPGAP